MRITSVRSYREYVTTNASFPLSEGDDVQLERIDCELGGLHATMLRKPSRAPAIRARLKVLTQDANDIARRYVGMEG